VAGAFSFGFVVSAALSPIVGWGMDTRGPRIVILTGSLLLTAGLLLSSHGAIVASLRNSWCAGWRWRHMMTYTVHSQFLPNWFVRRRGLATGIAFAGVGVGAIVLLPWLQSLILTDGWRVSCVAIAFRRR
jgi:hypothetical protein